MQANVTEIASNVFRISTFHPEFGSNSINCSLPTKSRLSCIRA